MGFCIVRGCKSRSDSNNRGRKFHVVPRDLELRHKWITAIGRTNLPKSGSVCSKHFLPQDYQLSRSGLSESLLKTAIPSQNLVPTTEGNSDNEDFIEFENCDDVEDTDFNQYSSLTDDDVVQWNCIAWEEEDEQECDIILSGSEVENNLPELCADEKIKHSEAMNCFNKCIQWSAENNIDYSKTFLLREMLEKAVRKNFEGTKRQINIKDFFSKS